MEVQIRPELQRFIEDELRAGRYGSAEDVINAALATLQSQPDGTGVGLTIRKSSWGHTVDGGEVFIDVPTIEEGYAADFQRIVAHEVGHAMQLDHNAPNNLMAAMATEDAPTPTCTDAAQWYAVRSEPAPTCPR